jgi:hypothetical protein
MTTTMTSADRNALAQLIRQRAKLMRTVASERAAELMADFERQLSTIYSFDQDEIWKEAHNAAKQVAEQAQAQIAERCRELGIPKEFAPSLDFHWYGRGQNASKDRRAELRRMAQTAIAASEKAARTQIERYSVEVQTQLLSAGLTSDGAHAFLANMPTVESLMPTIDAVQIKGLLPKSDR